MVLGGPVGDKEADWRSAGGRVALGWAASQDVSSGVFDTRRRLIEALGLSQQRQCLMLPFAARPLPAAASVGLASSIGRRPPGHMSASPSGRSSHPVLECDLTSLALGRGKGGHEL